MCVSEREECVLLTISLLSPSPFPFLSLSLSFSVPLFLSILSAGCRPEAGCRTQGEEREREERGEEEREREGGGLKIIIIIKVTNVNEPMSEKTVAPHTFSRYSKASLWYWDSSALSFLVSLACFTSWSRRSASAALAALPWCA